MKFKNLKLTKLLQVTSDSGKLHLRCRASGEIHSSILIDEIKFPIKIGDLIELFNETKRFDGAEKFLNYSVTGVESSWDGNQILTDSYSYPRYLITSGKLFEITEFRELDGVTGFRNHLLPGNRFSHFTEFEKLPEKCIFDSVIDLNTWAEDYRVEKEIHEDLYAHPELIYEYLEGHTLKDWENYFHKKGIPIK